MSAGSEAAFARGSVAARDLVAHSEAVLRKHARSFRWAALFLGVEERRDAAVTYAFCREVDDLCDEATDPTAAERGLREVLQALEGERRPSPLVAAYLEVAERRSIEPAAARDLVLGVLGDCRPVRVQDDNELLLYAYRVAGTVGLMMCGILGVTDPAARAPAIALGVGMQLTNICRDVREDATRGRVYLPAARLEAHGVSPRSLLDEGGYAQPGVYAVVEELLALAESYYAEAERGMGYLPPRGRLAVYVAARLYRAIGHELLRRGPRALAGRVVVSPAGKVGWSAHALLSFAGLVRLRGDGWAPSISGLSRSRRFPRGAPRGRGPGRR